MQTRKTKQKVTNPREVDVTLELISFTSGIPNTLKQLLSIFFLGDSNAGGRALQFFMWSFALNEGLLLELLLFFLMKINSIYFQRTPEEKKGSLLQKQIR